MSEANPRCHFCGREILVGETLHEYVSGWARDREQGGTNALVDRKPSGEYACVGCLDLLRRGRLGQESLLA